MIPIDVVSETPCIWNSEDACILREDHHICGKLTGCLPRAPSQNVFLGLPMQLMPEEATLLVEEGICKFVKTTVSLPSEEDVAEFKERRQQQYLEQVDICMEEKKNATMRNIDEVIRGKTAKRRRLLLQRRAEGEDVDEEELNKTVEINVEDIEVTPISQKQSLVQICTAVTDPQLQEDYKEWNFPSTDTEKLRYRVFKDMWKRGYYLTTGGKFGGDFLIYPGDPARFHAFYIAVCVPYQKSMNARELSAIGRLGSNVKKTVLLCSVDDNDTLKYTSLQWTGISS